MRKWRLREANCSSDKAKISTKGFYWSVGWLVVWRNLHLRFGSIQILGSLVWCHPYTFGKHWLHWASGQPRQTRRRPATPCLGRAFPAPSRGGEGQKGTISCGSPGPGPTFCLWRLWELPFWLRNGFPQLTGPRRLGGMGCWEPSLKGFAEDVACELNVEGWKDVSRQRGGRVP